MEDRLTIDRFTDVYKAEVERLLPRAKVVYVAPNKKRPIPTIYTYSQDGSHFTDEIVGIEMVLPPKSCLDEETARQKAKENINAILVWKSGKTGTNNEGGYYGGQPRDNRTRQ